MDFILFIFFVLICFTCRRVSSGMDSGSIYLSIDNTKILRGFLAVAIVLHHISEHSNAGYFFPVMVHAGYLIVAVFFFLSAYGLLVSYQKKGKDYLNGFWKNRILYLFVIWFLVSLVYWFFDMCLGKTNVGVKFFLLSFFNGHPIAKNSWYIIVQLMMYVFFWFAYTIPEIKQAKRISVVFALLVLVAFVFNRVGYGSIWYMSNFAFVFGLFYAEKNKHSTRC